MRLRGGGGSTSLRPLVDLLSRSLRTALPWKRLAERRGLALRLALSIVALAAVAWWALQQERPEMPDAARTIPALMLAAAIYAAATLARAERWHRILRDSGVPAERADSYSLTTVGYFGNNVLPARAGDVLRAFLLAPRVQSGKRHVFGTVVAEKLLDVLALALVFGWLAFGLLHRADVPVEGSALVSGLIVAALLLGVGGTFVALRRRSLLERARELAQPLVEPSRRLLTPNGARLLAMSIGIWVLEAGVYLAVAQAVPLDMGLLEALYVVALTNLFAMLPAAPGYAGTFDAAVVFGVEVIGGYGSAVVSYLLLLRFVLFVPITIVGVALFAARYGGWSRYRAARANETWA